MDNRGTVPSQWVCCQLGAREHYAVPRALQDEQRLRFLFTDAWVASASLLGQFKQSLRERYHPQLGAAPVASANLSLLAFEMRARLRGLKGWDRITARNNWFQTQALRALEQLPVREHEPVTFFAYSYAARDLLAWAKAKGWRTVLGQIDPGPFGPVANRLAAENPELSTEWQDAPDSYWANWRQECNLADVIAVNSRWSEASLQQQGIPGEKIRVVPLAFEPPATIAGFSRKYPESFSAARPLRVLFLGQVSLRKGAGEVLKAADQLRDVPVEFWLVGPLQMNLPPRFATLPNVRWTGAVPRSKTNDYYRDADVFLFPTFSDGFGLTQLEAQAWGLPVIASRYCGDVVESEANGAVLGEVSGNTIARVIRRVAQAPEILRRWAHSARRSGEFTTAALRNSLKSL